MKQVFGKAMEFTILKNCVYLFVFCGIYKGMRTNCIYFFLIVIVFNNWKKAVFLEGGGAGKIISAAFFSYFP
jgi:hypothetical protein